MVVIPDFFSQTLSELHRPPQNSVFGLTQAVHHKLFKGLFLSSLEKTTSKLLFCLYWFSSLLKVTFYPLCYWMRSAIIELNICLFYFFFRIKKLPLKKTTKPFKGKISEDQASLLVIWREYLSFCKVKARHKVLVLPLL